jgi:hypothetical protein
MVAARCGLEPEKEHNIMDYPFANRLYAGALDVLERFRSWGPTVILSDGDVVFQPRKVERSGISEAVDGHVLIYIHKEDALDDVQRRYPADYYVMVDDKVRILTANEKSLGRACDDGAPAAGQIRARCGGARLESTGGRYGRAHQRSPRDDLTGLLAGRSRGEMVT